MPNKNNGCHICPLLWQCSHLPLGLHGGPAPGKGKAVQVSVQGDQHHQVGDRRDICPWHFIRGEYEWYIPSNVNFIQVFGKWGFAGGATDDWYVSLGIPYGMTFELPDKDSKGWHGFLLPPENIKRVN